MTGHSTVDSRHKGNWEKIQKDCQLCEMRKQTEWYIETRDWVVAEKLSGGPFVVYKCHTDELSDEEWDDMERIVGRVFDEFELEVIMAHYPNHFHAHIRNYTFTENFK